MVMVGNKWDLSAGGREPCAGGRQLVQQQQSVSGQCRAVLTPRGENLMDAQPCDGCAAMWRMLHPCCALTVNQRAESSGERAVLVLALALLLASRRWEWSISAFPSSALPLMQLWISSGNRLCSVAGTQDLSSQFFFPSQNRFQICIKFLFILPPLLYVFAAEGKAESVQDRHWRSYHSSYEPSPAMVPNEPL